MLAHAVNARFRVKEGVDHGIVANEYRAVTVRQIDDGVLAERIVLAVEIPDTHPSKGRFLPDYGLRTLVQELPAGAAALLENQQFVLLA